MGTSFPGRKWKGHKVQLTWGRAGMARGWYESARGLAGGAGGSGSPAAILQGWEGWQGVREVRWLPMRHQPQLTTSTLGQVAATCLVFRAGRGLVGGFGFS